MPNKAGELPQGLGRGTAGRDPGPGPESMKRVIVRARSRLTCASIRDTCVDLSREGNSFLSQCDAYLPGEPSICSGPFSSGAGSTQRQRFSF